MGHQSINLVVAGQRRHDRHDRTETMGTASASVPVSGAPQVGPGPICVHLRPSGRLREAAPDKGPATQL